MHHLPTLRYAAASDPGRLRLANEDAAACDARLGLFVVCDGIGGRPSGEAASQIIAHTLAHALRRRVRKADRLGPGVIKRFLASAVVQMNDQLHRCSAEVPALEGMGCTIVAGLFDTRMLFIVYAGDSRAYVLRQGVLRQLTRDHSSHDTLTRADEVSGHLIDLGERRLLTRYVGMPQPVVPTVGTLKLEAGDRILFCSDGLTDPLSDLDIEQVLLEYESPIQASDALIDAANAAGGPDNITAVVVDYGGPRELTDADRATPVPTPFEPTGHTVADTLDALADLEFDLKWLQDGSRESSNPSRMAALAAAKKRLGHDTYLDLLARDPGRAPAHVFHQACTDPRGPVAQDVSAPPRHAGTPALPRDGWGPAPLADPQRRRDGADLPGPVARLAPGRAAVLRHLPARRDPRQRADAGHPHRPHALERADPRGVAALPAAVYAVGWVGVGCWVLGAGNW